MSAREQMLERLRAAQRGLRLPSVAAPPEIAAAPQSLEACLHRFEVEAGALGVECHVESTEADVRARLAAIVGRSHVLSWDAPQLPYDAGIAFHGPILGCAERSEQAAADIGVTGCDAAVAETASLVMLSAPGRSRTVSLLPPTHVALVERRQLCFSMDDAFTRLGPRFRHAASCTFITGPSRTADIELTLTLGIHGPGRVIVIIGP